MSVLKHYENAWYHQLSQYMQHMYISEKIGVDLVLLLHLSYFLLYSETKLLETKNFIFFEGLEFSLH